MTVQYMHKSQSLLIWLPFYNDYLEIKTDKGLAKNATNIDGPQFIAFFVWTQNKQRVL